MALFRVDFNGRGELADRQQKLAQLLSRLQKISEGISYSYNDIAHVYKMEFRLICLLVVS
jgi:hypothetical protein